MTPKEFEHPIKGLRESSLFSYNELCEFAQAYADKANKKLIAKIELLEACRVYDATGENRPDGYIVPNHYTGQRIDEMNKPYPKR